MYALQLGAVAIVAVTLWFLAPTRRRDGGDPGAPAGDVVSAGDPIRA
jgi:hypothetical protein